MVRLQRKSNFIPVRTFYYLGEVWKIKTLSHWYRDSHYKDKIVSCPSYLHNGNTHTWWNGLWVVMLLHTVHTKNYPESKVHGANMGPSWGRQDPDGPHVGPMNFAIWVWRYIVRPNWYVGTMVIFLSILFSQCHGCWWPGNTESQGISRHGIDLFLSDHSSLNTRGGKSFYAFKVYTNTFFVNTESAVCHILLCFVLLCFGINPFCHILQVYSISTGVIIPSPKAH